MYGFYNSMATEVYDLEQPIGYSFGDIEFYRSRLAGVTGKVLIPAVGSGRMMIPLIESGFAVEGMDVSTDMLDLCKDHLEARGLPTRLFQGSMPNLSIDETYEAMIIPASSFHLMRSWQDAMQALNQFYEHLSDQGRLIFDITFPSQMDVGRMVTREWETLDGDLITLESKVMDVNWVKQLIMSIDQYQRWHRGQFVEAELERMSFRWFGIEEVRLMLERAGFTMITLTADYDEQSQIHKEANTITFEAIKTSNI